MIGSVLLGRYEVLSLIEDGPMFGVYRARDKVTGRDFGIRLLKPPFDSEQPFIQALSSAISSLPEVNHPGVEKMEALDVDGKKAFILSQASPGISLHERIRRLAPFSVSVAVGAAISILEGLDALHQAGVVHGDVGSKTISVGSDGSARVQLGGIWRAYSASQTAGAIMLSSMAPYLAPEVGAGSNPSKASDVYSAGVLLYELLCGRLPYAAETPVAMAMKHAGSPTPSVKTFASGAPVVLDEIVKKSMSKDPLSRYPDAGAMLSDLRVLQDALRFGKQLSWPLHPDQNLAPAQSSPFKMAPKSTKSWSPSVPKKPQKPDRDVPVWMMVAIGTLIGATVAIALAIYFYFNLTRPKMVVIPNIVGRDVSDARTLLQSMHLQLRENGSRSDDTMAAESILESDPIAGDRVREGGVVSVIVSSGKDSVAAPDLTGLSLDQAQTIAKSLGLSIKDPPGTAPSSTVPRGNIIDQDPPPSKSVSKRTMITVRISTGPPAPSDIPQPSNSPSQPSNPAGSDQASDYQLRIRLTDATHAIILRVDISDSRGTRTILNEAHDVGDVVDCDATGFGPQATFNIYYDGVLRKTVVKQAVKQSDGGQTVPPDTQGDNSPAQGGDAASNGTNP